MIIYILNIFIIFILLQLKICNNVSNNINVGENVFMINIR